LAAYCNIFLNPLIYVALYDVVRRSLVSFVRSLTARAVVVANQQQQQQQQQQQPVDN